MPPCDRARARLINWTGDSQAASGDDRFIPRKVLLQELFTRSIVRTILQCYEGNCKKCKRDYNFICSGKGIRFQPADEVNRIFPQEPQINDVTASAIQLFALLVRIEHPLLIIPLLEHGRNDGNILDSYCDGSFRPSKIRGKYWSECHRKPDPTGQNDSTDEFSNTVARLLEENFSIFFRPIFRDEKFHVLPDTVKLPFFNETPIDQGSFGKVFAFQIFEGHNKFSKFGNVDHFARKVISRNKENFLPGYQEGHNLSLVNTLENAHIVQVVTSFTYKDEFNIVFPRSLTNLEKALREPRYRLGQIVPPLRSCPIWLQMLGLAEALRDFSNGSWVDSPPSDRTNLSVEDAYRSRDIPSRYVATHFDLKPSNILINERSRNPPGFHFIITDFGLAYIKDANSGSSGTRGRGGDDTYAPPEYLEERQSRKYDIWSLGCIYLEVLTFLVLGYEGVLNLDKARGRPSTRGARQTTCFWEQAAGSAPSLKEEVQRFVLKIQERAELPGQYSPQEQLLIKNTIFMILKMLSVQPETRLSSNDVVWYLKRIGRGHALRDEQSDTSSQDRQDTQTYHTQDATSDDTAVAQRIVSEPDWQPVLQVEKGNVRFAEATDAEIEVEPRSLRSLRGLFIRSNIDPSEEDSQAVLQVFTEDDSVRFVITSLNLVGQEPREQHCLRQQVHIMPQYAFRKNHNEPGRADAGIRLVWASNPRKSIMRYDISGQLNDLRKIHGALLGQDIYHTTEVDDVEIVRSTSLLRRRPKLDITKEEKGPFTVQLWREKQSESPGERRRKARTCRIVIYFSETVYVIPFNQAFRFPGQAALNSDSGLTLKSGTVGERRQQFEMIVLQTQTPQPEGPKQVLPTFPLDPVELENMLTDQPKTFKSIKITFRAHEHLDSFWKDYRVLKEDWLDEIGVKPKIYTDSAPILSLDLT